MYRNIPWRCLFAIALVVVFPSLAWAQEEHGNEMDPLDFFDMRRWDLGLWTLVVFGGLLLLLRWKAWGPIMDGLEKRENTIRQAREDAIKAKDDAEAIRVDLEKKLSQAHDQARGIVDEARRDGQALIEEMRGKAQSEIQAERDRQRREIETAKDQALQEIWTQAVQVAALMSSKAIQREMSPEDHRRLLDESLAELGQKMKN